MFLTIELEPDVKDVAIPVQYNQHLQAAIYDGLSKDVGGFFHDTGFDYEGRRFKLFTFSRLMGKSTFDGASKMLNFEGRVMFIVSSPIKQFCSSLSVGLLKLGIVRIDSVPFSVRSVQVAEPKVQGTSLLVKCASPVTVHSTLSRYNGSKYTCYFETGEPDFDRLILLNLDKKFEILTQEVPPTSPPFKITPRGTPKRSILNYKGTVIKGYTCRFLLEGPQDLLQVALEAGIGSKNSQGFGCIVPDQAVPANNVYI